MPWVWWEIGFVYRSAADKQSEPQSSTVSILNGNSWKMNEEREEINKKGSGIKGNAFDEGSPRWPFSSCFRCRLKLLYWACRIQDFTLETFWYRSVWMICFRRQIARFLNLISPCHSSIFVFFQLRELTVCHEIIYWLPTFWH